MAAEGKVRVSLLDYGAGNVRSLINAIRKLGYEIAEVRSAADIRDAQVIVFPGVGSFGQAMASLHAKGWVEPLIEYLRQDRPFFGICLGMQVGTIPAEHTCPVQTTTHLSLHYDRPAMRCL